MPCRPIPLATPNERAEETTVRAHDGTRLATDVYYPSPFPRRRLPTILVRLPYEKGGDYASMPEIAPYIGDRGYVVVVQDVRGKGRSEGRTEAFANEIADASATLDWIEAQPWSNGSVGMFGDSYYGLTEWAAAATKHRALKAIVPRFCSTQVADDWLTRQGVFNLFTMSEWAAMTWVDANLWEFEFDWSVRPFCDLIEHWLDGRRSHSFDTWVDGIVATRSLDFGLSRASADLSIPALHVGGTWDVFCRGQISDFQRASSAHRAPQHLVLRATDHYDDPIPAFGRPVVDRMADPSARQAHLPRTLDGPLAFYDRFVAGRNGHTRLSPVSCEIAHGPTISATSWPPPGATWRFWFLADTPRANAGPAGGALAARPDRRSTTLDWDHDPLDPVPTSIAYPWRPLLSLPDERATECRGDVVTFTSDSTRESLDMVGFAVLDLELAPMTQPGDVMVKLVDVEPTGRATMISEGAARFRPSDESALVSVDLGSVAYRMRTDHRLRIQVAGSSFPRYPIHPGTDEDPMRATTTATRELRCRISQRSALRVQVLEPGVRAPDRLVGRNLRT